MGQKNTYNSEHNYTSVVLSSMNFPNLTNPTPPQTFNCFSSSSLYLIHLISSSHFENTPIPHYKKVCFNSSKRLSYYEMQKGSHVSCFAAKKKTEKKTRKITT